MFTYLWLLYHWEPGCLYPRHSLGPCCGWWALTGKWVSWQPNFGGLDVYVDFLASIKARFFSEKECSQFCWRPFGACFFTLHFLNFDVVESEKDDFQPFPRRMSSCGIVARVFCRINRINITCVDSLSSVLETTSLHCQGQDRLELFRGGRNDSVTLCLPEWGNRSKRATRQWKYWRGKWMNIFIGIWFTFSRQQLERFRCKLFRGPTSSLTLDWYIQAWF